MSIAVSDIRDKAKLIVNNIAFGTAQLSGTKVLRVIDINNPKYVADFTFDRSIKGFVQVSSTFAEGKRKYEMLYLVERNKEELLEVLMYAKVL